jgi:hypothetical protein
VIARADQADRCARPELVKVRYTRMSGSIYSYLRASRAVLLARRQLAAVEQPLPNLGRGLGPGDPHLENYGVMRSDDGLVLTVNDWDSAGEHNFAWGLERLAVSMALTTKLYGYGELEQRTVLAQTLSGYRSGRCGTTDMPSSVAVDDLIRLAPEEDGGIDKYTSMGKLRDGLTSSGRQAVVAVPGAFEAELIEQISDHVEGRVIDVGVLLGRGISGLTRWRILALIREGLNTRLIEFKELIPPGDLEVKNPLILTGDIYSQPLDIARELWPSGVSAGWRIVDLLGQPMWLRPMLSGEKGFEYDELASNAATPEGLGNLAQALGWHLGSVHALSDDQCPSELTGDHVRLLHQSVTQLEQDHQEFKNAFATYGVGLGAPVCESIMSDERGRLIGRDLFGKGSL